MAKAKKNQQPLWRIFFKSPVYVLLLILIVARAWQYDRQEVPETSTFNGENYRLERVHDGDTVTLRNWEGQLVKIRFYGLDSPELNQPGGPEAKKFLSRLLLGQNISLTILGYDQYDRFLGRLFVGKQAVDEIMIAQGQAWVYPNYCRQEFCDSLRKMEQKARRQKLGLWSNPQPIKPWQWRQGQR